MPRKKKPKYGIDCSGRIENYMIGNLLERKDKYDAVYDDEEHIDIFNKIIENKEIKELAVKAGCTITINLLDELISYFWDTVNRFIKFKIPIIRIPYFGTITYNLGYYIISKELNKQTFDIRNNKEKRDDFVYTKILEIYKTKYPNRSDKIKLLERTLPYTTVERLYIYKYKGDVENIDDRFKKGRLYECMNLAKKLDIFKHKTRLKYYNDRKDKKYKQLSPLEKYREWKKKHGTKTLSAKEYANLKR